jgi:hypothetical protein
MSVRKSISFADDEIELLDYFETNGQSKIAKTALQFYKENKDKIFINSIGELVGLLGKQPNTQQNYNKPVNKLIR